MTRKKDTTGSAVQPSWPRRWSRRMVRVGVVLLVLLFALRVVLWLSLPWFLERTLNKFELTGSYDKLSLSVLTGDAELWHLIITPVGEDTPITDLEYCRADISLWTLLRGHLVIPRLEVDGLDITVHRRADGSWMGWEGLAGALTRKPAEPPVSVQSKDPNQPLRFNLKPPLRLDALRLQHVQVSYLDELVSPPIKTRLDLNLRLSDLGSMWRRTRFSLSVITEGVLDRFVLEGSARGNANELNGSFSGQLQGAHLDSVQPYLNQTGVGARTRRLDSGFRGSFDFQVTSDANDPLGGQRLAVKTELEGLRVAADTANEITLGHLVLDAAFSSSQGVELQSLQLSDGSIRVYRDPEAGISLAGIYLLKPKHLRKPKAPKPVAPPVEVNPVAATPTAGMPWSVGAVDMQNVELIWDEDRIEDVPPIQLQIERGTIGPLEVIAGKIQPIPLQVKAKVVGIIETGTLAGSCDFMSPTKYVDVKGDLQGITPAYLGGYLAKARLESEHHGARLRAHARWSMYRPAPGEPLRNSALLQDITLEDQGQMLAALDELAVEDIASDKRRQRFSIGRIAVKGDETTLHWDPNGDPHMWGFGLAQPKPPSEPDPNTQAAPVQAKESKGPEPTPLPAGPPAKRRELLFPEITWDVGDVTLIDESDPNEGRQVHTASLVGTVENLIFNASSGRGMNNGRVDIRLAVPGLVEGLSVTGALSSEPPATRFNLDVDGTGLALRKMQPYLQPLGVVPHMDTSTLHLNVDGRVVPVTSGVELSLDLGDCALADAHQTYLSLAGLRVEKLQMGSGRLQAQVVEVNEPMVAITRDPNGLRIISGISFIPRPPKPKKDPPILVFDRIAIHDASLALVDQRLEPPLSAKLSFDVLVQDINTLTWDSPAQIEAQYQLPGVMDHGSVQAAVMWSPQTLDLQAKYTVTGLHPHLIARYLPEGSTALVRQGRLAIEAKATVVQDPNGGKRWDAQIRDLDFREVNEPSPWLHLDEAKIALQTLDASARQWVVDEICVSGVEARTERGQDGRFHTLGFALGQDPNSDPLPEPISVEEETGAEDPNGSDSGAVVTTPMALPRDPLTLREALPEIVLHRVHLGIRKLSYQDFGKPAEPVVALEDMVLANTDTIELLGDAAATHAPAKLNIQGRVTPWVDSLTIHTEVAPFAAPSSLVVDVNLLGIQGTPIMAWFPTLTDRIDASEITDGRLRGKLEVTATVARRHFTEFDFQQPFGATATLRDLHFRHGTNEQWNGLDEARVEVSLVDLRRRNIQIRSVELLGPKCYLAQEPNGLRILNVVVKRKTPAATEGPAPAAAPVLAAAGSAPAQPRVNNASAYRVRLDQLMISGLDFEYRDTTVSPPTYLPLNGLDLDLRGVVYPVPSQPSPIRFNTVMTAGRVPITNRDGSVTERFLMQELTASGHVTPGEKPAGWLKMGVRGFEMRALRGMADRKGIQIRQGIMDLGVDVRVRSSRTARTTVKVALSDLSVRDSSDGAIANLLLLPVSLDAAIYMLQDIDGSLRVTVPFTLDLDTLSPDQLNAVVLGATATVLGKAIATSPVKLVTGTSKLVTDTGRFLTGQTEPKEAPTPVEHEPLDLIFEPGATVLNNALQTQVGILAKRLRKNKRLSITVRHQFGIGDLLVADRLANPSLEDNQELMGQLRHLTDQTSLQRVNLASRTRAAYAAGDMLAGGQLSQELAELDGRLGLLELALDNFLERLGPGSAHIARRRTRDAALSGARARLSAVRDALNQAGIKHLEDRLQITQPSFVTPEDNQPGRVTIEFLERR